MLARKSASSENFEESVIRIIWDIGRLLHEARPKIIGAEGSKIERFATRGATLKLSTL